MLYANYSINQIFHLLLINYKLEIVRYSFDIYLFITYKLIDLSIKRIRFLSFQKLNCNIEVTRVARIMFNVTIFKSNLLIIRDHFYSQIVF